LPSISNTYFKYLYFKCFTTLSLTVWSWLAGLYMADIIPSPHRELHLAVLMDDVKLFRRGRQ